MTSPRLRLPTDGPFAPGDLVEGFVAFAAPQTEPDVVVCLSAVDLVHGTKIYRVLANAPLDCTAAGEFAFALRVPESACAPPEPYGPDDPIEDTAFAVTVYVARVGRAECFIRIAPV
jgi:hypothetical protein